MIGIKGNSRCQSLVIEELVHKARFADSKFLQSWVTLKPFKLYSGEEKGSPKVKRRLPTAKVARRALAIIMLCGISAAAPRALGQAGTYLSPQGRNQAIAQLDAARARDNEALSQNGVTPAEAADLLSQAATAGRVERELKDGLEVSGEEIADALVVQQSKISPEQRAELIERLNKAKQADEYRMNNVNGDSYGHNLLRAQASLASRTIDELKAGNDVPWSQINKALEAPRDR